MTHARDCCSGGGPSGQNCPAPCLAVTFTGIDQEVGGVDSGCFIMGGASAVFETGVDGAYILDSIGGGSYEARVPVLYADVQSTGVSDVYTIGRGGVLVIHVSGAVCENGIVNTIQSVNAYIDVEVFFSDDGSKAGPASRVVFASFGIGNMGEIRDSSIRNGCTAAHGTHFGGTAVVSQPGGCTLPPIYRIARKCDDYAVSITFDQATRPEPVDGSVFSIIYRGNRFIPTAEQSTDDPVAVEWSSEFCDSNPPGGDNRIAVRCFGTERIVWDPSQLTGVARTCTRNGKRYKLIGETTTDQAVAVVFSTRSCYGIDLPNCTGITGPDDPRCDLSEYAGCPMCYDGTQIDPPIGPNTLNAPDDSPGLPGLGDMVEIVLKAVRLDKIAKPGRCGCQRRKEILNEYGQRYGRAIIKALGL